MDAMVTDEKTNANIPSETKAAVQTLCKDAIEWLDANPEADQAALDEKEAELNAAMRPHLDAIAKANAAAGTAGTSNASEPDANGTSANVPGANGPNANGPSANGPVIEEVDDDDLDIADVD